MKNIDLKQLAKKVFKYLIITLLIWFVKVFMFGNVNAITIKPYDYIIFGTKDLPTQNWIRTNNTQRISQTIFTLNTTNITTSLPSDVQLFTEIYACVVHDGAGDLGNSTYITNVAQDGGFKNGNVNSVNLNVACKVPDGYGGTMYKFYFQIYSWEVPAGGADFYRVSSYWNFNNLTMKTLNITITNIYITDTDNYLDDATLASQGKGQQIIINQANTIINKQDQTNSKLDDLNSKTDKTNQQLKDMNDYLKDNTDPNVDVSSLGTVSGLLPAGPVDSLLNIPFKFLSVLSSSVSGACVPVSTNWVFNTTLNIPCFSEQFYSEVPTALMTFLQVVPCAFILIKYFKHLYKKVDRAVTMNTTADDEWGVI